MILKTDNHTRYNTDDLNTILALLAKNTTTYSHRGVGHIHAVAYGNGKVPEPRRGAIRASGDDDVSWVGDSRLLIASPNRLSEDPNYGLAMLGGAEAEFVYAPTRLVEQIVEGILRASQPRWVKSTAVPPLVAKAKSLAAGLQLRIMDRVEAPVEVRKPSKEKTIARLKQSNFYGTGGILEGPRWAWASGSRCPTAKWQYRVKEAAKYYNRERSHRIKYRDQLIALGETPREYETFAQYLRRLADEIESSGGDK